MRYTISHHLDDGRRIEVSAERHGDVLRLRAWLVGNDLIEAASSQNYDLSSTTIGAAIADFTAEFEDMAGVAVPRPLLPDDLFALKCPAAPAHWQNAVLWGIAAGADEQPLVTPIPPEPLTPELLAQAAPCTPREIYRIGATCIRAGCVHWRDRCTLVERVVAGYPVVIEGQLQPCGIRSVCRWFAQERAQACRVCPGVVTDIGELPQDTESEAGVAFF
jgi:hypothetical protein